MTRAQSRLLVVAAVLTLGCDGQQYVSPDTVALVIAEDSTRTEHVNRCHFIPVLLGSRVNARYRVDEQLLANIDVTRDQVAVFFEGSVDPVPVFRVESSELGDEAHKFADAPPPGYSVELRSPCSGAAD